MREDGKTGETFQGISQENEEDYKNALTQIVGLEDGLASRVVFGCNRAAICMHLISGMKSLIHARTMFINGLNR